MSEKIFRSPTEVFEDQLNDIFEKKEDEDVNSFLRAFNILLHSNPKNKDMIELYNLLGLDDFVAVISLFENRTIHFPDKETVKDTILTALIYYYRDIEDLSWNEIREKIPFEFSIISYSMKIKKLNEFVKLKLREVFEEEENVK